MQVLADATRVAGLIDDLAAAIRRGLHAGAGRADAEGLPWAIVGIRSRGDVLAKRLAAILRPPHVGALDITLYRDDLSEIAASPVVRTSDIPFNVDGLHVVLVDDVLMTGRSVRAAMQSLIDLGRPRRVWLSVLVDRGGRELPIAADHVALDLRHPGPHGDMTGRRVEVHLQPTDAEDAIILRSR